MLSSLRHLVLLLLCAIALFTFLVALRYFDQDSRPLTTSTRIPSGSESVSWRSDEPIQPLPPAPKLDPRTVQLGSRLFHDPRLSHDNTISCANCHDLSRGGVDHQRLSKGVNGTRGKFNTPTVFNSVYNFRHMRQGTAATLEDQLDMVINSPIEMKSNWAEVVAKLGADENYVQGFTELYKDGVTVANIKDAIVMYEKTLVTPDSRFDRYLRGDDTAITENEKEGYHLFKSYGCVSCHQGRNVGGNHFQKLGVMFDYLPAARELLADEVEEQEDHHFVVPSLRNVAVTGPYFHDGDVQTLEDAVHTMAIVQTGQSIPDHDIQRIVQFLHTLTGEYQGHPL